jgi:hypothetical protein
MLCTAQQLDIPHLGDEIWAQVASHLPVADLSRLACVARRFSAAPPAPRGPTVARARRLPTRHSTPSGAAARSTAGPAWDEDSHAAGELGPMAVVDEGARMALERLPEYIRAWVLVPRRCAAPAAAGRAAAAAGGGGGGIGMKQSWLQLLREADVLSAPLAFNVHGPGLSLILNGAGVKEVEDTSERERRSVSWQAAAVCRRGALRSSLAFSIFCLLLFVT